MTEINITQTQVSCFGIRLSVQNNHQDELGWAFLYILKNNQHKRPFGLMEDVYISEKNRGQGIGSTLIKEIIKTAKDHQCYKLIATSRYERLSVHKLYTKLGFNNHGHEFRIDFHEE